MGQAKPILFSGDPALGGGSDFFSFTTGLDATINNSGQVGFGSVVQFGKDGVFRATASTSSVVLPIVQIARTDDPTPSNDGTFWVTSSRPPSMNDAGTVAFYSTLFGASSAGHGLYVGNGPTRTEIMRDGQMEPGGDGKLYFQSAGLAINTPGQVAFAGSLFETSGGGNDDEAIYRWDGPGLPLVPVVRKGDSAPTAGTFTGTAGQAAQVFAEPTMNDFGQVAFSAAILGSADSFDNGLFIGNGTTITQVARRGQFMPGGGEQFDNFSAPALNNPGHVAFAANYFGNSNWDGVFRSNGTTTTTIARTGDLVPDGSGTLVDAFDNHVALNDAGQATFVSVIAPTGGGSPMTGLFRGDGTVGGLRVIAREEIPSPDGDGSFSFLQGTFAMNEAGQVAFTAGLDIDPTNVTPTEEFGLFFHDDDHGLIKIIRQNDPFLGSTVTNFDFAGNSTNVHLPRERTGLNDLGQVAFTFALADGRVGLAVWSIPEPGTVTAMALVTGLMILRRRRSRARVCA
jgi:hypothetical protein